MNLEELEGGLPNGLHDAEIKTIHIEYARRLVTLEVAVWIGDMLQKEAPREAYRDARIIFEGVYFVSMDPPDPEEVRKYWATARDEPDIDVTHDRSKLNVPAIAVVPGDYFVSGLFVFPWNSFIVIAARSVSLEWMGEMIDREPEP